MEKEKRSKILVIVALALTLVALTVGFAAFSTTLNISSNATVTPNEEDFKIKIYGMKDTESADNFGTHLEFREELFSTTVSHHSPPANEEVSGTAAIIDNTNYTISNIKAHLVKPNDFLDYIFVIRNEGKYDAYLDLTNYHGEEGAHMLTISGTCKADEGTSTELLDKACPHILNRVVITNSDNSLVAEDNIVTIPKNDYIILGYAIEYEDTENRVDGPFTVEFPSQQLIFSTAK